MKKITTLIAALACTFTMQAQSDIFNHLSMGVGVGTTGWGFDVAAPVTEYFTLRAGVNFFPSISYSTDINVTVPGIDKYQQYIGGQDIPNKIDVKGTMSMTTGKVLIDVYPFKTSSFFMSFGGYFGGDEVVKVVNTKDGIFDPVNDWNKNVVGTPTGELIGAKTVGAKLGDYLLTPNDDGNAVGSIKVAKFRPYLGIGFGRTVPKKSRVGCSLELGCQFWGSPKVYCNDTQLEENKVGDSDEGGIIKTISKITVYPSLTFRVAGRIF